MNTGKVVWYNQNQGFGFVAENNGVDKLYFHAFQKDAFAVGKNVTFDTELNPRNGKLIAVNVQLE